MPPRAATARATTGADLLRIARQHVGEKYVFGALVPKDNPSWKGPWDCAEFVSWVVYQSIQRLYGCENNAGSPSTANAFTGFWRRDAHALNLGVTVEEAAQTAGAILLRFPGDGATGHIVFCKGDGGTIEAHSSKDGVVELKVAARRWDIGILLPQISYSKSVAIPVPPPSETIYRLTAPPMKGEAVRKIQRALKAAGYDPGVIDAEFGPHTQAAVVAFQRAKGLAPDGEVGKRTWKALGLS